MGQKKTKKESQEYSARVSPLKFRWATVSMS